MTLFSSDFKPPSLNNIKPSYIRINNHGGFFITHELIEQKETKLQSTGTSKSIIVPATWIEKMQLKEDSVIIFRLAKGKKGLFFDGFKKKGR